MDEYLNKNKLMILIACGNEGTSNIFETILSVLLVSYLTLFCLKALQTFVLNCI